MSAETEPKTTEATPPAAPAAPTPPAPAGSDNVVPVARLNEVSSKLKAAEKEAADLRKFKEKAEAESMSEIEKANKRAADAEAKAAELETKYTTAQRSQLVQAAALQAGFADPQDAVAFLRDQLPEDQDQAVDAVKQLADSKPHLLKADPQPQPRGFGRAITPPPADEPPRDANGEITEDGLKEGIGRDLMRGLFGARS